MSLTTSWYTIDEASAKFGISIVQLKLWVDLGMVRSEGNKGETILVNGDDVEQELHQTPLV